VEVQIEKRTIEVSPGEKLILQSINKLLNETNRSQPLRNITVDKFNQLQIGNFNITPGTLLRNGDHVLDQTIVYLAVDPEKAIFLDLEKGSRPNVVEQLGLSI
jgi:hypothetical protein